LKQKEKRNLMSEQIFINSHLDLLKQPKTLKSIKKFIIKNENYLPKNFEDLDDKTLNEYFQKIINILKENEYIDIINKHRDMISFINLISIHEKFHYMMLELDIIKILGKHYIFLKYFIQIIIIIFLFLL
jgi:hypothetical protein